MAWRGNIKNAVQQKLQINLGETGGLNLVPNIIPRSNYNCKKNFQDFEVVSDLGTSRWRPQCRNFFETQNRASPKFRSLPSPPGLTNEGGGGWQTPPLNPGGKDLVWGILSPWKHFPKKNEFATRSTEFFGM